MPLPKDVSLEALKMLLYKAKDSANVIKLGVLIERHTGLSRWASVLIRDSKREKSERERMTKTKGWSHES